MRNVNVWGLILCSAGLIILVFVDRFFYDLGTNVCCLYGPIVLFLLMFVYLLYRESA